MRDAHVINQLTPFLSLFNHGNKIQYISSQKIGPLPDGFFAWISPLWNLDEQQILSDAGMDVVVYLRFYRIGW